MRRTTIFLFTIIFSFIFTVHHTFAETIPKLNGPIYVQDLGEILSDKQHKELMELGTYAEKEADIKISLLTVDSLKGLAVDEFSKEFAANNQLDKNGLLLLLAVNDRKIRMEVGSNLQSIISDEKAGEILDQYALPYLENNQMANALEHTYKHMFNIVSKEFKLKKTANAKMYKQDQPSLLRLFIIIVLLSLIVFADNRFFKGVMTIALARFIRRTLISSSRNKKKRKKSTRRKPPTGGGGASRRF